jgi:hypothetical protein
MCNQRQGLRIMDDDRVAARKMEPGGILEHDLLVDSLLRLGEFELFALQRVVKLLGAIEEGRRALDLPPAGLDADGVHHQGERRQDLGDAAAVEGRVDVDDMRAADAVGLLEDPLGRRRADQRLVLVERMEPKGRLVEGRRSYGHRLCLLQRWGLT